MNRTLRILVSVSAILSMAFVWGCSRTPQLAGDEECIGAMDALWTAVTSKREPLLERCAGEIERLHASGQLGDDAYEILSGVVTTARAGDWARARTTLKSFMRDQRPTQK